MNEMNNRSLHQALNQATADWHVQSFVVLTKDSKQHIDSLEGLLRKDSGEGMVVKLYTLQMLEADPEKMAPKISKWIQQGRLGGTTEDGRVLFHEEVAKHLAGNHTFIIKSGGEETTETFEGTVEGISSESYQMLAAALELLAEEQSSNKTDIKDKKTGENSPSTKTSLARSGTRTVTPQISLAKNPLTEVFKRQILQRIIEQERNIEKSRQEKAAKEKEVRKEREREIIKKENLKEDLAKAAIKQEGIKTDNLKHDRA